ncbi:MAG: YczE/YyaS/YitT family protein [Ilumatobacteraceae bacterium]
MSSPAVTAPSRQPRKKSFTFRFIALLLAVCAVGVGISLMVRAQLGVAPADVLATGGAEQFGIGVGTMGWINGFAFTALAIAFRRPPQWGTLLGTVMVGQAVNIALPLMPESNLLVARLPMMLGGMALLYLAISVGVATTLGTGPMELLMLGLNDKGLSMQVARWGIEGVVVTGGILLGGQIGIGTVLFVLLTGPVLARTLPPVARFMGTEVTRQPVGLDA